MVEVEERDGVFVLRMRSGENRFNLAFLEEVEVALDRIEQAGPGALVTVGEGKFYSNGLDLEWMAGPGQSLVAAAVGRLHGLFARMLSYPTITVAALNGHAYAGGAVLALAHDYRVMREDRGYFCLPEVDIKLPFTAGMSALIRAKLPAVTAHDAMVSGKRYTAAMAASAQIVHDTGAEPDVLPKAIALAKSLVGKHGPTLAAVKRIAYADALSALEAASGRPRS